MKKNVPNFLDAFQFRESAIYKCSQEQLVNSIEEISKRIREGIRDNETKLLKSRESVEKLILS